MGALSRAVGRHEVWSVVWTRRSGTTAQDYMRLLIPDTRVNRRCKMEEVVHEQQMGYHEVIYGAKA